MLKNKKFILFAILATIISSSAAQTNSPYSRYGYGILRDQAVGPSKGMGGIGYGLRHKQGANPMNPASYSNVDSLTFLFDIGVNYTNNKLSENGVNQNDDGGGLEYITMLFPVSKHFGLSFGVLPYSTVGYSFGSRKESGNVSYIQSYDGSGGLSQIYGGLGIETPFKGLSVGANISYLFGKMNHTRSLPTIGVSGSSTSIEESELKLRTAKFDIGLQYQTRLSSKDVLTIGAFYSPKINSKGDYRNTQITIDPDKKPSIAAGDTIKNVNSELPATYGIGFSFARNRNLVVGADITYQEWEKVKFPSQMGDGLSESQRFNNRWKYAAGIEYSIDPYDRNFFKKIKFRGGFNYSNSYLNVGYKDGENLVGKGYNEYGATIGLGLPIKDSEMYTGRTSYINITFEYKKIDPKIKSMIKEEFIGISLGVNINDLWFVKRKIY